MQVRHLDQLMWNFARFECPFIIQHNYNLMSFSFQEKGIHCIQVGHFGLSHLCTSDVKEHGFPLLFHLIMQGLSSIISRLLT